MVNDFQLFFICLYLIQPWKTECLYLLADNISIKSKNDGNRTLPYGENQEGNEPKNDGNPLLKRFCWESSKNNLKSQRQVDIKHSIFIFKKMALIITYRMNSTNTSTSKHSDRQFHEHRQVYNNSISLFNTVFFQVICQLSQNIDNLKHK